MTIRFAESGGQYHASNVTGPGVWRSVGGAGIGVTGAIARNGSQWAYGWNGSFGTPLLTATGFSGMICGYAAIWQSIFAGTLIGYLDVAGNNQCDLRMNASGQLYFTRNGTQIGGFSTSTITSGAWHYYEFKALFATTATGTCEVYVDGALFLTVTGVQNATTTAVGAQVVFYTLNQTNNAAMDFYVLDTGTGLDTTYLGDVTVAEIYDNGPGVNAAWAVAQPSFVLSAAAAASGGATTYTGIITNGASPANAWQGFYFSISGFTNAANTGGPWLCTASTATTITLLNPSGVAETHAGSCAFQNPVQAGIHGGIVDGYATTNVGTRPPGDNQYISDATAGDKSDFAHQTLTLTGTIAAVVHVTQARKDDAGTRQIQQMCLSGGTEEDSATITLGANYQYYSDILEADPHTGVAWTVAGFNAATFGVKEIT